LRIPQKFSKYAVKEPGEFMKSILLLLLILIPDVSFADEETQAAVKTVQEQMKSPKFHKDAAKESKEAAAVEKQVKELAGSEANEQEIYNLAADVLGNMKDLTPEQMTQLLQEAQNDPQGFASKFSPEQRRKLKELAERIPAAQKKRNP